MATEPKKYPTPIEVLARNPKSMRSAVNAKCYECIYDARGCGNWRQQVAACTSASCPLYAIRPLSKPKVV